MTKMISRLAFYLGPCTVTPTMMYTLKLDYYIVSFKFLTLPGYNNNTLVSSFSKPPSLHGNFSPDLFVKGHDVTKLASMAKLKAGRLARETTDACLQYWGGMGYTSEVEVSRLYRDTRLLSIGGGADEVMLSIICKLSGTLPKQ